MDTGVFKSIGYSMRFSLSSTDGILGHYKQTSRVKVFRISVFNVKRVDREY